MRIMKKCLCICLFNHNMSHCSTILALPILISQLNALLPPLPSGAAAAKSICHICHDTILVYHMYHIRAPIWQVWHPPCDQIKAGSVDRPQWHPTAQIAIPLFAPLAAGLRTGIWQALHSLNSGCSPASQNADVALSPLFLRLDGGRYDSGPQARLQTSCSRPRWS